MSVAASLVVGLISDTHGLLRPEALAALAAKGEVRAELEELRTDAVRTGAPSHTGSAKGR